MYVSIIKFSYEKSILIYFLTNLKISPYFIPNIYGYKIYANEKKILLVFNFFERETIFIKLK